MKQSKRAEDRSEKGKHVVIQGYSLVAIESYQNWMGLLLDRSRVNYGYNGKERLIWRRSGTIHHSL